MSNHHQRLVYASRVHHGETCVFNDRSNLCLVNASIIEEIDEEHMMIEVDHDEYEDRIVSVRDLSFL